MTALLRDGSTVEDPRLDRLVQFDEKSREFAVRTVIPQTQPRSYTWGSSVVLDQGSEGACVGFSVATELAAKPKVVTGMTDAVGLDLYHRAQHIDHWIGCYLGARCPVAPTSGGDADRYDGTSVLAGVKAAQQKGHFKEYRWAFGVADLALAVSRKGPAILGIEWHNGMYTPTKGADGLYRITRGGGVVGGHAILCVGFNVKRNEFCLLNTWGVDWGKNGRAWVSYADMDALLRAQGEAVIPIVR